MDVFSVGLQVAFAAVFVVVLIRYLQDRRPVNRDLVIVAGFVAGWFLVSTLIGLDLPVDRAQASRGSRRCSS